MIVQALGQEDAGKRAVAADCILALTNKEDIQAVANAVANLPAPGKLAALYALREQADPAVRAAAVAALEDPNDDVRQTALHALIAAGTGEDVPRLATLAAAADNSAVGIAAFETLRLMRHPKTNEAALSLLSDEKTRTPSLLEAAFARRSPDFVPRLSCGCRVVQSGPS